MSDSQFVQNSTVDFLIPEATDIDIEEALSSSESPADGDEANVLARIPQRSLLYFDESLSVYVILRTTYRDDQSLQKFVPRLNIVLEAMAFSSPAVMSPAQEAHAAAQARDVVWTAKLDVREDPVFVVVGSGEDEDGQDVLLIWKMRAFLARPKVRLQAPALMFRVSAMLRPPAPEKSGGATEAYLPSGVPFATNVLEPLGDELLLSGSALASGTAASAQQVSATRQAAGENLPLHTLPRRAFRAIPAISSRIRYHRSNGNSLKARIIATLELDALKFGQHAVEVEAIRVTYVGGSTLPMLNAEQVQLPRKFEPTDNLTCLYVLDTDAALNAAPGSAVRTLDVAIDARVLMSGRSHPRIEIRWRQNADLSALTSVGLPSRGSSGPQGSRMQRDKRPTSINTMTGDGRPPTGGGTGGTGGRHTMSRTGSSRSGGTGASGTGTLSGGLPTGIPSAGLASGNGGGISATFTKSANEVTVGAPFRWEVSVVNRSGGGSNNNNNNNNSAGSGDGGAAAASPRLRQFALAMLPRRPGASGMGRRTTRSTTLVGGGSARQAEAVVDDNVLYATIKAHGAEATQLVCMSADARTSLLGGAESKRGGGSNGAGVANGAGTGQIYTTDLVFLPLTPGYLSMQAIRVTDLETGEAVDVAELPDVLALERE